MGSNLPCTLTCASLIARFQLTDNMVFELPDAADADRSATLSAIWNFWTTADGGTSVL